VITAIEVNGLVICQPCSVCGKAEMIRLTLPEVQAFRSLTHVPIQRAFRHWTDDQRELLQTGMHPACYDSLDPVEESSEMHFGGEAPEWTI
jgi:hypothetical protein